MSIEVFSSKKVFTISFFKTIKDVDLCSTFESRLRSIHEILYKYTAPSDDVQRRRTITLLFSFYRMVLFCTTDSFWISCLST